MQITTDKARWFEDSDGFWIAFRTKDRAAAAQLAKLVVEGWQVVCSELKRKRSLDANAYYWSLLGQLRKSLNISQNYCHNMMLRRYGTLEEFDGKPVYVVLPDSEEAEKKADEAETYHIRPTSQTREGKDGKRYRTYMLLKGSSEYNTAEMSTLISGLIEECRQQGIETMTKSELAALISRQEGQ